MFTIKSPHTKQEFKDYYALRYHVLREPLGLPHGTEKDDYEVISEHFMVVEDQTGEIVGVVKLYEDEPGLARFSHLAVSEKHQGQGIGQLLVETVEKAARKKGYKQMGTLTRVSAVDVYEKYGYERAGMGKKLFGKLQTIWMLKSLE
jgi:N-acetylglutamate synthase-like GNAT family acetyltransferase